VRLKGLEDGTGHLRALLGRGERLLGPYADATAVVAMEFRLCASRFRRVGLAAALFRVSAVFQCVPELRSVPVHLEEPGNAAEQSPQLLGGGIHSVRHSLLMQQLLVG
jgi:hypothetical protein